MKRKIICITGASGGIGRSLLAKLSTDEYHIKILTRNNKFDSSNKYEIFIGDLSDPKIMLDEFISDCDILFHCAGEIKNEKKMYGVHVGGIKKLLDALSIEYLKTKKKIHWIQLSSCGAYGQNNFGKKIERTITELSKTNPSNIYEKTKLKSDELVIESGKKNILYYTILRPSNVIGFKEGDRNILRLIRLIKSGYLFFYVSKDSIANYIHVDDVVRALLLIANNFKSRNEIFNLSSDCYWEDLILTVSLIYGVKVNNIRISIEMIQFFLRLANKIFGALFHIPLLAIFSNKTKYSSEKIKIYLNFTFSNPIPDSINDIYITK